MVSVYRVFGNWTVDLFCWSSVSFDEIGSWRIKKCTNADIRGKIWIIQGTWLISRKLDKWITCKQHEFQIGCKNSQKPCKLLVTNPRTMYTSRRLFQKQYTPPTKSVYTKYKNHVHSDVTFPKTVCTTTKSIYHKYKSHGMLEYMKTKFLESNVNMSQNHWK